jgi:UDP-N-acetylmuramoylalanine--D-glutamate ligase
MDSSFFKDKKITVMGLGLHGGGTGIVKFLAGHGARLIVTDIKTKEQLSSSLEKLKGLKNIEYILGQHRAEDFTKVDMVVKTPPVPWNNKHIKLALDNKIPVEMDSSLFFKLCKNPIIGVTGTKGKTTTATLIYEILKSAGKSPVRAGIGQISALDRLSLLKKNSVAVFELSSWRLSALGRTKMSPQIAVILNIFPDHLNYYSNMEKYIEDKKNIFLYQKPSDWLVVNRDDEKVREISKEAKSQIIEFSRSALGENNSVFIEENAIFINDGNDSKKLISLEEIKMKGEHNIMNILAAIGAARACGINFLEIKKAVANFSGVPHRLEFVRELNGVKYYNDTAATIPEAVISALNSYTEPIILIAGGTDKGLDFSELGKTIAKKAKGLVFLKGNATEKMIDQIKKNLSEEEKNKEFVTVDSMEKAVELASRSAEAGDAVLLSPGATSFGIFLNEFDRGDKFKEAVNKLK